jgi:hypothetical protein
MPVPSLQPTRDSACLEIHDSEKSAQISILGTMGNEPSEDFMLGRESGDGNAVIDGIEGERHFQKKGAFVLHDNVKVQTQVRHNPGPPQLEHSKARPSEYVTADQRGF